MWSVLLICTAALSLEAAPGRKQLMLIVAHPGYAPEQTRADYLLAIRQGADFVEQDLVLKKDEQLVCLHDVTLAEIKQLDAGSWFDAARFAGERVLTFQEAIDILKGRTALSPQGIPDGAGHCSVEARPEVVKWAHDAVSGQLT